MLDDLIADGHGHYREIRYMRAMRHIDFSLRYVTWFDMTPVLETCQCWRCRSTGKLLTWPGRRVIRWPDPKGSCFVQVALQLVRISLLYSEEPNPQTMDILRRIANCPTQ